MKTEKQRFLDFVENYKKVYSIIKKEEISPKTSYLQFDKYLSDNKEIIDAFENLVKDNGESGFISRPGTGKSTLVLTEVFNNVKFDDNKKHLLVITLPNKVTEYPDFVKEKWSYEKVVEFCTKYGVTVQKETKEDGSVKEGTVIGQSRQAGMRVTSPYTLIITVAVAPAEVEEDLD